MSDTPQQRDAYDILASAAASQNAEIIIRVMLDPGGWMTLEEIARMTPFTANAAREYVGRLTAFGLIEWIPPGEPTTPRCRLTDRALIALGKQREAPHD